MMHLVRDLPALRSRLVSPLRFILLLLLLPFLWVSGCEKQPQVVEATQLAGINVRGVNGLGEAEGYFTEEGLRTLLGLNPDEYMMYRQDPEAMREKKGDTFATRERLIDAMRVSIVPAEGLSNGDEVAVSVDADTDAWEKLGYHLKLFTWRETVKHLDPLQPVDVTSGLSMRVDGYNGYGTLTLSNPALAESVEPWVSYHPDRERGLSNGDVVRVEVEVNDRMLASLGLSAGTITPVDLRVQGLPDAEAVDPVTNLELLFDGMDGRGTAELVGRGVPPAIKDQLHYVITPDAGLSNGDSVKVSVHYDREALLEAGYRITKDVGYVTVSGLNAWRDVNPFETLSVTFDGISGEATAELGTYQLPGLLMGDVDYRILQNDPLANGDTVTVEASADEDVLLARGVRLEEVRRDFPVSGLKEIPRSLEAYDLSALLKEMAPQVEGEIETNLLTTNRWQSKPTQSTWETEVKTEPVELRYLYSLENPEQNFLMVLYRTSVSGRISRYRSGRREKYKKNAREEEMLFVAFRVWNLGFRDGEIEKFGTPRFHSYDTNRVVALEKGLKLSTTDTYRTVNVTWPQTSD